MTNPQTFKIEIDPMQVSKAKIFLIDLITEKQKDIPFHYYEINGKTYLILTCDESDLPTNLIGWQKMIVI